MDQEVVVKEALTSAMIDAGAALIQQLDSDGWPVTGAFWFYLSDVNRWRLFVVSPEVGKEGPLDAYRQVQTALTRLSPNNSQLTLHDITVSDPSKPLAALLQTFVKTAPGGIAGLRLSGNAINGRVIEDAYVYRMM